MRNSVTLYPPCMNKKPANPEICVDCGDVEPTSPTSTHQNGSCCPF